MLATLARRGPDGEGLETWPGVALGHRRLAILDLSEAGRQPMLSDDRKTGVVFNGCIYNFLELRADLEKQGCRFRSRCDTEVLLWGYREWGVDGLVQRLRGMFAFAIWDDVQRKLLLVRDRLGVKPLIYAAGNGHIAFASTVKALRAAGLGGEMNPQAMLDYLEFGFVTDERSIFEGICKLPPATILEWRDGNAVQRSYWSLPDGSEPSKVSFEEAVEETERLFLESVRLRMHSDVPIGVLLSGGVDSALVCWAVAKLNGNIKAFTVGTAGDASDETESASQTARMLGIPHEVVQLPHDRPSLLDEIVTAYSEPFASPSAQGVLLVSQAVKASATVLLTGDGGDDVFLGYPFLANAWLAQRFAQRLPDGTASLWKFARPLIPPIGPLRRARNFVDYAIGGIGAHARAHDGLPMLEKHSILGERLTGLRLPQREVAEDASSGRRLLFDVLRYHRKMHFTSEFMQKVDAATMYYSIEARSPFLDQKIWEFTSALPPQVRFHRGRLKAVLREIVRRQIGETVAARRKQGFTVPVERWLASRWSSELDRLKEKPEVERHGWVRPGSLVKLIDEGIRRQWVPLQFWFLLVLERWLEENSSAACSPTTDALTAHSN
jgi:asparagine synthase (glutamine-hydrolysing)